MVLDTPRCTRTPNTYQSRNILVFAVLLLVAHGGCIATAGTLPPTVPNWQLLRNAPTTVKVHEVTLSIKKVEIWRDRMPLACSDYPLCADVVKHRKRVAVFVTFEETPAAITQKFTPDKAWIIAGESQSAASIDRRSNDTSEGESQLEIQFDPEWDADGYIDIVIRIRDAAGNEYYLGAPHQRVHYSV